MTIRYNGERYVPGVPGIIELEHMHRYALALPLSEGKQVLDVASGEGYGSYMLASNAKFVVGVDISAEAIGHAAQRYSLPNLEFRQGSCAALPVEDESIDLIVSFETIEHHDQHQEMMREIARVLRPDGLLLISSPNKKTYTDIPGAHNSFHVKELYLEEFKALLHQHWPNVALYGQRVLTSSLIAPFEPVANTFRLIRRSEDGMESIQGAEPAIYFIALASKVALLPVLGVSAYESSSVRSMANTSQAAPSVFEVKCYWKSQGNEYSELETIVTDVPVNGQLQKIQLEFAAETNKVQRIRLDLIDAAGVVDLRALQLLSPDESVIWQWQGDLDDFQPRMQVVLLPSEPQTKSGCTLVSLGSDPWFEIDLPPDVYAQITPGCALALELAPYSLLERLPAVMANLAKPALPNAALNNATPVGGMATVACHLSQDLEAVATLIAQSLAGRDQAIARKNLQLRQMRDELLRAEAQLDLLKDVMLGSREEDRL
jgi:ubiquinone/menaquinone biosynthesis C-methylase UbiE